MLGIQRLDVGAGTEAGIAIVPLTKLADLRRHAASMVFQGYALLPHRTVLASASGSCSWTSPSGHSTR